MKKFFKNLAMACLAALSCVAIGLGTGCEAVNSVLGTFESLGGHIGNVIDKVTHECEYNVMKHDADNHWNECECGEKDETSVAAHVYDNACDTTCNVCGAERKVADHVYDNACDTTCNVCGAERKVADHVYDNACDADCNVCGATRTPADHVYDNACDADCNVCGATRTPADHVYDNACDADCNVCGATRTPADHVYDNACDTTCNVCGAEREITHDYSKYASDATNHWKVCSVCGVKEEGSEAAHTGGEATATEQAICDVCKAPYGETLPYVTAALMLDGDATNVTIPAGKYAQVSVNTMYGTIVLEFSENVTVTVDGEEVENGAVVEYNVRLGTSIVVTPVDATAETVATIKAKTYVDPATILSVGENNVTVNGEQAFVLDIEVGKAYDLTIDYTLYVVAEYSNGVTDSYVVTGYLLKLEEGVSVKLLVSSNDWDSPEASGTITISEHTKHTYVWMKDLNNHWQGCGCGVVVEGTKAAHTYDYECSDTCNVCNAYRFDAADHDYTVAGHDKDGHWKECVCGTRDYSSYEAHYGGTATDSEQAVCEGCGESYGDTLTTAFKDLRIDFPYGLIQLTVPAGKTLDVNLLIEENAYLKITFKGDVTVMFGRRSIASGDVIEVSNFMHTLTVIANDTTVDTVVKMNADTYVVENGELVLGENEVEAIASPELEFVFTAEEANTYTITADDTLLLSLKTENGSETVDSGYTFTLEAGASITFIIIPSDWNSQATGKVTIAVKTAEEHTHDYTILKSDATGHWYVCSCGEVKADSKVAHSGGTATCTAQAVCEVCGKAYGELAAHTPAEDDGDCTTAVKCKNCDVIVVAAKESHTGGTASCTAKAECSVCGTAYGDLKAHTYDDPCDTTCNVCGAEREITHDYSKCMFDETNHWKVCSVCGVKDEATVEAHKGGEATCTKQAECSVCGTVYGDLAAHTPAEDDGDCTTAVKCKNCDAIVVAAKDAHEAEEDDGDCTTAVKCKNCDAIVVAAKESHTGGTATCKAKAVCEVCGTAYGDLAAHTYDNNCDADCNVCGATRTPADHKYDDKYDLDCNVCGAKREVELTIAEALAYGATFAHNKYSAGKYYVTATIKEVYNTTYGNMYVIDGEGNQLTVYGTYNADGSVRYDAMEEKPIAGSVVKLYGIIGQFSGTPQMKNGWLIECKTSDASKVAADAAALKLPAQLKEVGAFIDLAAAGANGSTIAWALKAECANVSLADGKLTVLSIPTEDVEVVLVATLTLNDATATKELTVIVKAPVQEGEEELAWRLVTNVSELQAGAKIVIVAANADKAISTTQNNNNRAAADVTKNTDDTVTIDEASVAVLTLVAGNKEGTFALKTEDGKYLYAASGSKNHLKSSDTLNDNASWLITITDTGVATIKAQGTNKRNWLRYNPNNGSPIFSCYGSGQQDVCIYVYA